MRQRMYLSHRGDGAAQRSKPHVFAALDGLRGVAALAVILFHLPGMLGPVRLPHGYLAVDFFFMLSGFVLAYAYGERLDRGWPTRSFLLVRWVRLYPLYALSMCFGFATAFLPVGFEAGVGSLRRMLVRLVLGLLFLPSFASDMWLFPLNFPSWSILLEGAGNVGHALLLRRRRSLTLLLVAIAAALAVAWSAGRVGHMNFGAIRPVASLAVFRLIFGYVTGMLLYRFWTKRQHGSRALGSASAVLLCGVFALPASLPHVVLVDLVCALAIFPPLVLAAAWSTPGPRGTAVCKFLGQISYPVYLLHIPTFFLFAAIWPHSGSKHANPTFAMGTVYLPTLLLLSYLATRFFDAPIRAWLTHRLQRHLV
ncbi:acyltransferase family protein [Terriglobus sp.]|uniref:acyltransferase family protein n=1 Tax=Terriglobus sp. TaxID=1889013 RepID=UPI003B0004E6